MPATYTKAFTEVLLKAKHRMEAHKFFEHRLQMRARIRVYDMLNEDITALSKYTSQDMDL